jgi:transcriptional regulator with XRE-family HTH domain
MSEQFAAMVARLEQSELYAIEEAKFDISEVISGLMQEQEISKTELAGRIQTSLPYITKILRGNVNFTVESLVKIARALDCTLNVKDLFVRRQEPIATGGYVARTGKRSVQASTISVVREPEEKKPAKPQRKTAKK